MAAPTPPRPRVKKLGVAALCGLFTALLGAPEASAKGRTKAPQANAVSADDVDDALGALAPGDPCRAEVRRGLLSGERTPELTGSCSQAWGRASGRFYRAQWPLFGLVDRRQESLAQLSVVLSTARRCRRWLLRDGGRPTLIPEDARQAKCSIRRFRGALPVYVIDAEGTRARVIAVEAGEDGRFVVRYADIDAALRLRHEPPLERWSHVELGEDGWAGSVDLREIRRRSTERHRVWVERGRGVPALFVIRHPEHRDADEVRLLAEEARFLRQSADYEAVLAGEMTPRRFLTRYLVSRYHRQVRSLESFLPDEFEGKMPLADEELSEAPAPSEAPSACPPGATDDDECTPSTSPPPEDPRPGRGRGDERPPGFLGVPAGL